MPTYFGFYDKVEKGDGGALKVKIDKVRE